MTLPDGWKQGRLGELCSIEIGGTPSRGVAAYWDSAHGTSNVWVSIRDMRQRLISGSAEQISGLGVKKSNVKLQQPGTVLLSFKLSIGRVAIAAVPLFTNEAIAGLSPTGLTRDFLFHGLQGWDLLQGVDQAIKGATLNKQKLKKILFEYPESEREQAKIAEVLSTVDRAIEETEALIAKQQRIMTGLMQDLLTRGIDEHGNLRSEQTHKFKESPLGRIPVEWECKELSQVLVQRPRNGLYKPASLIGRGTLLVGQTSFTQDRRLDFSLCRRAVVSPSEIETFGLVFGDILVTRVFATVDGVGQPVLVDSPPEPAVYESNMLLLRPDASIIDSLLLFTWLRSTATRRRVLCSVNASNQVSVNQTVLNSLAVPVPSISEQKRISQALGQIDAAVRCTDVSLQKLRLLKTGLMRDLLTGERRVTALLGSPKERVDA